MCTVMIRRNVYHKIGHWILTKILKTKIECWNKKSTWYSLKCMNIRQRNDMETLCCRMNPNCSSLCASALLCQKAFSKERWWKMIYHTNYEMPSQPDEQQVYIFWTLDCEWSKVSGTITDYTRDLHAHTW